MTNEFEYSDIDDEQLRKAMPYTEGIVRDAILSLYDRLIKSDYALTTYYVGTGHYCNTARCWAVFG
jgi:hypothetical protein